MTRYVLLALVGLLLCGCTKFTRERFDWIETRVDDRDNVQRTLGDPVFRMDDQWYYEDLDRHIAARVFFDPQGVVSGKQWMDANTGEWHGDNPELAPAEAGEKREDKTKTRTVEP
ncbi:MAG: hypothetical protein CHACPFDD_00591 [Phycisphaerae bacterium]|nr:hypothetical protein [Phycisphaerae bacterium]